MTFSQAQLDALAAPLSSARVKTREQSGRKLSYVEGWWAISEANRIFGFDSWSSETTEIKCVSEHERPVGFKKEPGWGVTYIAKVRIEVCFKDAASIIREGSGTGHGIDRDRGLAHESALKEAETDARKRALMTFGNPFGLALYDKEQNGVEHEAPAPKQAQPAAPPENESDPDGQTKAWRDRQIAAMQKCNSLPPLYGWLAQVAGDEGTITDPGTGSPLDRLKRKSPEIYGDIVQAFNAQLQVINRKENA